MIAKFNNNSFFKLIEKFLSTTKYFSEDIGVIKKCKVSDRLFYLLMVDEKIYVIKTSTNYKEFKLDAVSKVTIIPPELIKYGYGDNIIKLKEYGKDIYYEVHDEQKTKILDYKQQNKKKVKLLELEREKERIRLQKEKVLEEARLQKERHIQAQKRLEDTLNIIEKMSLTLLDDEKIKLMMTNFMLDTLNDFLLEGPSLIPLLQDIFQAEYFNLKKVERGFYIDDNVLKSVKECYDKLIKLFMYKGLFDANSNTDTHHYMVITAMIRHLSKEVYGKRFEELYGGYFNNLSTINFKDCLNTYFSIEIINPLEVQNISLFTYFLILHNKIQINSNQELYFDGFRIVEQELEILESNKEMIQFEQQLLKRKSILDTNLINIDTVDLLSGNEFETVCSELFKRMGYSVQITKRSGDQGIDVIAIKNGIQYGIQSKCYSSTVGNKAIQEVAAGVSHYKLDKGIVITNNYFTDSAKELARSNNVILWDRFILREKLNDYFKE